MTFLQAQAGQGVRSGQLALCPPTCAVQSGSPGQRSMPPPATRGTSSGLDYGGWRRGLASPSFLPGPQVALGPVTQLSPTCPLHLCVLCPLPPGALWLLPTPMVDLAGDSRSLSRWPRAHITAGRGPVPTASTVASSGPETGASCRKESGPPEDPDASS